MDRYTKDSFSQLVSAPKVSDNIWNLVTSKLPEFKALRILEYGSGGSTLDFIKILIENSGTPDTMELVSVEHNRSYYKKMCLEVVRFLEGVRKATPGSIAIKIFAIQGPCENITDLIADIRRNKLYHSQAVYTFFAAKRGMAKILSAPLKVIIESIDTLNTWCSFWSSKTVAFIRYYFFRSVLTPAQRWSFKKIKVFTDVRQVNDTLETLQFSGNALFEIQDSRSGLRFRYFLFPDISQHIFWRHMDIDGTIENFEHYVTFPYTEGRKFNIIFIDGRSRISCLKRVWYEQLLSENGYLFVHDAQRDFYHHAFSLFPGHIQITGSNKGIDGRIIFPRNNGDNPSEIAMFQNRGGLCRR